MDIAAYYRIRMESDREKKSTNTNSDVSTLLPIWVQIQIRISIFILQDYLDSIPISIPSPPCSFLHRPPRLVTQHHAVAAALRLLSCRLPFSLLAPSRCCGSSETRRGSAGMGGAAAGTKWIHHIQRLSAAKVSAEAVERGQSRVIDASLTLIRERAKLKVSASIGWLPSLKIPAPMILILSTCCLFFWIFRST